MNTSPPLLIESPEPATTVLTLNRPQRRNALNIELLDRLCDALDELEKQEACRTILLRGAGKVFCSGLDLIDAADSITAERSAESVARLLDTILRAPALTIAAAHGAAYAGGGGVMAACDFVVAADNLRIGFPEVRRGLVPALITRVLRNRVTGSALRELVLLAEPVDAARAQQMGLVQRVVPEEQLLPAALEFAKLVSQGGPQALRATKELLRHAATDSDEQFYRQAVQAHMTARNSSEAAEGLAAFQEKRQPNWTPK